MLRRWPLLSAAAVLCFTCYIHVFLGGPEIIGLIQGQSTLPAVVIGVATVLWHNVTLEVLMSVAALLYLARHADSAGALFWLVFANQAKIVALFLFYNFKLFRNSTEMPQWTLFLVVMILMLISLGGGDSTQKKRV